MNQFRVHLTTTALFVLLTAGYFTTVACWPEPRRTDASPSRPRYRIAFSTYLGGSRGESLREIILCRDGSLLVGGVSTSHDFPVTAKAFQKKYAGDDRNGRHGGVYGGDSVVARISSDGKRILQATYFGGSRQERNVYGMALDKDDNVIITTMTRSPDVPTTKGCFQPKYGGGKADWTVAKLSKQLDKIIWCTYIGGREKDNPRAGLVTDAQGNIYVAGGTSSPDFPVTVPGKLQGIRDGALVKLKPDGSGVHFARRFGGSGWDGIVGVQLAKNGDIHVCGHTGSQDLPATRGTFQPKLAGKWDVFAARLSPDARKVRWTTYVGGEGQDCGQHLPAVMPDGSFVVTGFTRSKNFPTTKGAFQRKPGSDFDGFVVAVAPDGKRLTFGTRLGGNGEEEFLAPEFRPDSSLWVVGSTRSTNFPITSDAIQTKYAGAGKHPERGDGALVVFDKTASKLRFSTFLGGTTKGGHGGVDMIRRIAFGSDGSIYLVGTTSSADFPVTKGAAQTKLRGESDGFVMKLVPVGS